MKVKVKETQEIIDVEFAYDYNSGGQIEKIWQDSFSGKLYRASQLEQIKEEKTASLNKEELIQFLKENLQISIYDSTDTYDGHTQLTVSVKIGDEVISSSSEWLYIR